MSVWGEVKAGPRGTTENPNDHLSVLHSSPHRRLVSVRGWPSKVSSMTIKPQLGLPPTTTKVTLGSIFSTGKGRTVSIQFYDL